MTIITYLSITESKFKINRRNRHRIIDIENVLNVARLGGRNGEIGEKNEGIYKNYKLVVRE